MRSSKLAWREIKNSKNFSFIFILNLSLGLLGFLLLNSFNDSLNSSLEKRAKTLLAADLSISARRNLTDEEQKLSEEILKYKIKKHHHLINIYSMGSIKSKGETKSRLMQIKGIGENYPLYGKIELSNAKTILSETVKDLESTAAIWISEELKHQFKIDVGDNIKLGNIDFTITNIIKDDSTTSWRGVGLAPKVYVGREFLLKTGLISFGSVAGHSHQYLFKEKEDVSSIKKELLSKLTDPAISVNLPGNSSEQVGRVLNYLTDYLGLVALVALFLSGIGTAYLFQSFLFIRLKEIGILKSLGLTKRKIIKIYALQVIILGVLATIIATIFSYILIPVLKSLINGKIGLALELSNSPMSILVSLIVAILTGLFVCLPILFKVLSKSTSEVLFGEDGIDIKWYKKDVISFIPLGLLFWILSIFQAHSLRIGSIFVISILISISIFIWLVPRVLKIIEKKLVKTQNLSSPLNISWGLSLRGLVRNSFATTMSFLALALGVMLLSLIGQLEQSLQSELIASDTPKPSLFLFDIQEDQQLPLIEFSKQNNIPLIKPRPMVRARITKINGKNYKRSKEESTFQTREEETQSRFRNRGVNLSFTDKLDETQTIVSGKEFSGAFDPLKNEVPQISLEVRYAQRMGVEIGDILTFDILGVEVEGKIVNLRKVKWTSFNPNFFILFQPNVIDDAPKTFLAAVKKMNKLDQFRAQDLIVEKFHNISILNVTQLVSKILEIFGMMAIAIKVMALLCLLVGMVVIFSITQHQIQKDSLDITIQKVLGLRWPQQLLMINKRFVSIVILATLIGSILSIILGNILSGLFFDGVWTVNAHYFIAIFIGIVFLTMMTVSIASINILKQKSRAFLS